MLFHSLSISESLQHLWHQFELAEITDEVLYQKFLELDPDSFVGLVGSGKVRWDAGDTAGAEEFYWRGIEANPCLYEAYLDLAHRLHRRGESPDLARGLAELGILKKMRAEPEQMLEQQLDFEKAGIEGEALQKLKELSAPDKAQLMAYSLLQSRAGEATEVTERLRPLRLIEQVLDEGVLTTETVDEIIAEGPAMAPLLVGILRAWAQDFLGDDEDADADLENALALLGETGSPGDLPHVLEFVDLQNDTAAGAATWALGRITTRYPDESAKLLESIAGRIGMQARIKVIEQMLRYAGFDSSAELLEQLSLNLEGIEQEERDEFFPLLLGAMAAAQGQKGVKLGRAALMRQANLLSRDVRRACGELLTDLEEEQVTKISLPPSPFTVYDICAGEAVWDVLDEDEAEIEDEPLLRPEPIRRAVTPGRNDPCWCNSGKKYKKCHLDSDASAGRHSPGEST